MAFTSNSKYDNRLVVSVGQWLLTFFLLLIPLVNLIMLFIWAFGGKTPKSKENWAKAFLLILGIGAICVGGWLIYNMLTTKS